MLEPGKENLEHVHEWKLKYRDTKAFLKRQEFVVKTLLDDAIIVLVCFCFIAYSIVSDMASIQRVSLHFALPLPLTLFLFRTFIGSLGPRFIPP
jgi:tetrahydromethanopterin S-methyltransferase subunit E